MLKLLSEGKIEYNQLSLEKLADYLLSLHVYKFYIL